MVHPKPRAGGGAYVAYHKIGEAQLYAEFNEAVERRLRGAESRMAEWAAITADYNAGRLVGELRKLKGARSERGLRDWHRKWVVNEGDMFEFVHKGTAQVRGRKVTFIEQNYLLAELLCGWEKPIMSAIRGLKVKEAQGVLESPSSIATLKRWVADFAKSEPGVWVQGRRGDKAVMEDVVKSVMRDDSSIEPLQVVVIDGHVMNVFVKHPMTGKPFRPTLIMVLDWGTRYPVGASLGLTEDSAHTLTAIRNGILHMGVVPRWALLDNGKAFRSKLFNAKWEDHDLEREFAGIFPRLGIEAHFAKPYNAKSKVVERFFRTLHDQWEVNQKSYCGGDIKRKPAHYRRNEKWMLDMFGGDALEYGECMSSLYEWIRWEYGMMVHSSTKQRPYEAFTAAARDVERMVDMERLNLLMLVAERKRLRSEGIVLYKNLYWAPELVDYVGSQVVIRYDYNDLRSILVFDEQSRFICQAPLREAQSGWIYAERDNPLVAQRLWAETREIEGIKRSIRKKTKRLVEISKRSVDEALERHSEIIEERKAGVRDENPVFVHPPMIGELEREADVNDEIAALERMAEAVAKERDGEVAEVDEGLDSSASLLNEGGEVADDAGDLIRLEDLLDEAEGAELAETVSFSELQKIIGLKQI